MLERFYYQCDSLDESYEIPEAEVRIVVPKVEANLVGSRTTDELLDGMHLPIFDIDYEARLVPSRTPGHHHLFLDHHIEWPDYILVMQAMQVAGLLNKGWVENSIRRGEAHLRYSANG